MLALQKLAQQDRKCTVNILPCRIHHSGPAKITKRHWAPTTGKDDAKISYFRGRKLNGKAVRLPAGYTGVVVKSTERELPQVTISNGASESPDDSDDEVQALDDIPEPVKILESTSQFSEVVIWGHDQTPDCDDAFVKGVEEWHAFAAAINQP